MAFFNFGLIAASIIHLLSPQSTLIIDNASWANNRCKGYHIFTHNELNLLGLKRSYKCSSKSINVAAVGVATDGLTDRR